MKFSGINPKNRCSVFEICNRNRLSIRFLFHSVGSFLEPHQPWRARHTSSPRVCFRFFKLLIHRTTSPRHASAAAQRGRLSVEVRPLKSPPPPPTAFSQGFDFLFLDAFSLSCVVASRPPAQSPVKAAETHTIHARETCTHNTHRRGLGSCAVAALNRAGEQMRAAYVATNVLWISLLPRQNNSRMPPPPRPAHPGGSHCAPWVSLSCPAHPPPLEYAVYRRSVTSTHPRERHVRSGRITHDAVLLFCPRRLNIFRHDRLTLCATLWRIFIKS